MMLISGSTLAPVNDMKKGTKKIKSMQKQRRGCRALTI
jgi:hypothetical protein